MKLNEEKEEIMSVKMKKKIFRTLVVYCIFLTLMLLYLHRPMDINSVLYRAPNVVVKVIEIQEDTCLVEVLDGEDYIPIYEGERYLIPKTVK